MIIYIFNHQYPDGSGFSRRCEREIKALSTLDQVTVICRRSTQGHADPETNHQVQFVYFDARSEVVHRPDSYSGNGWYEIKRNVDLLTHLFMSIVRVLWKNRHAHPEIFAVTSPLTVPLMVAALGTVMGAKRKVIAFHDLEPELAMHLKRLPRQHWLVILELFLERLACAWYQKVIVTTESQAEVLMNRASVKPRKIDFFPNVSRLEKKTYRQSRRFEIAYLSTISFDYTLSSFLKILESFKKHLPQLQDVHFTVIGDGEGLPKLKQNLNELGLESVVTCVGYHPDPADILNKADLALIPWEKDMMTETMLPTKLFEYLSLSLPVLAPRFGEFEKILSHKKTALLYSTPEDAVSNIEWCIEHAKEVHAIGFQGHMLFSSQYTPEIIEERFLDFYRKA